MNSPDLIDHINDRLHHITIRLDKSIRFLRYFVMRKRDGGTIKSKLEHYQEKCEGIHSLFKDLDNLDNEINDLSPIRIPLALEGIYTRLKFIRGMATVTFDLITSLNVAYIEKHKQKD